MKADCSKCGKPIRQDTRWVKFLDGTAPVYALEVKIKAEWCANCDSDPKITVDKSV